jgi:hypothetical protein
MTAVSWPDNWQAHGWALSAQRRNSILAVVDAKVNRLNPGELDAAVETLCQRVDSKHAGSPSIRQIVAVIFEGRAQAAGIDTSKPFLVAQAESRLHRAPAGGLDRWEIVCEIAGSAKVPNAGSWCKHLLAYAKRLEGGLTAPYWSRQAGCPTLERADYLALIPTDRRAVYERMSLGGGTMADAAVEAVAFEGRVERAGASRRDPGEEW